ncbi:SRPBCC domain-containing protein [Myroides fluvii]|uniref:SRPBCC domain-containing protein n=1 Tax=Myroides fluvii TaxID=2572594 RepID=UPI00131C0B64|nr:SRPBCC domain-containing protein [Myroides fluvii]
MKLVTQIEINANAETIWNALIDFENYKKWNPFITKIKGTAAPGHKLKVHIQNMHFSPIIQVYKPHQKLTWLGKLGIKGLFDGYHYFEIVPIDEHKCLFIQGENFSGLLVPLLKKKLKKETLPGFILMNCSLKEYVE